MSEEANEDHTSLLPEVSPTLTVTFTATESIRGFMDIHPPGTSSQSISVYDSAAKEPSLTENHLLESRLMGNDFSIRKCGHKTWRNTCQPFLDRYETSRMTFPWILLLPHPWILLLPHPVSRLSRSLAFLLGCHLQEFAYGYENEHHV